MSNGSWIAKRACSGDRCLCVPGYESRPPPPPPPPPPQGEPEFVAGLWAECCTRSDVGVAIIFELGGHSLTRRQLVERMLEGLQADIRLSSPPTPWPSCAKLAVPNLRRAPPLSFPPPGQARASMGKRAEHMTVDDLLPRHERGTHFSAWAMGECPGQQDKLDASFVHSLKGFIVSVWIVSAGHW